MNQTPLDYFDFFFLETKISHSLSQHQNISDCEQLINAFLLEFFYLFTFFSFWAQSFPNFFFFTFDFIK